MSCKCVKCISVEVGFWFEFCKMSFLVDYIGIKWDWGFGDYYCLEINVSFVLIFVFNF